MKDRKQRQAKMDVLALCAEQARKRRREANEYTVDDDDYDEPSTKRSTEYMMGCHGLYLVD